LTAIFWSAGLATPAVVAALVVAPLSASVVQMLVEFFGKQYVDYHREQTRERQQALVNEQLSQPLATWLTQWPTTGGSAYERLQQILNRFPENLKQLSSAVADVAK
jgi:predicted PurR-regulated permease PerM